MSKADELAAALGKVIGENEVDQECKAWIDTGYPPLNKIIAGDQNRGFPQGRISEIYGPSSSGKTAIATKVMVEAQRLGGVAMFFDHERSFDLRMAMGVGLVTTPGLWVYKLPRTWEESAEMMLKAAEVIRKSGIIADDAPIVGVTDSVASCIPQSMLGKDLSELNMNDNTALARCTSQTLKIIKTIAREQGLAALYLNQIRTKPGVVYGNPTTTPGGGSMEFYADCRLAIGRQNIMKEVAGEGKVFMGQKIGIKAVKSKFTKPFQECDLRLMFRDDGMAYWDVVGSLIEALIEKKEMPSAGHITWVDGKKYPKASLIAHIEKAGQVSLLVDMLYGKAITPAAAAAAAA